MQKRVSLFALAFIAAFLPSISAEAAEETAGVEMGREYHRVTPAQPTNVAPAQVEVLEFFWYGCPHCFEAEAFVQSWLQAKPDDIVFTRVPATLNRGWVLMAQAYYTAEELGVLDVMHPALFAAFHVDPIMLGSPEKLASYFKDKAGVDNEAFAAAFNSPTVSSKVQHADLLARRYRIRGVPTMIVNGKFVTDPNSARGYAKMVEVVDLLARQELAAQSPSESPAGSSPEPEAEPETPSE